jgi:hypothetical protein
MNQTRFEIEKDVTRVKMVTATKVQIRAAGII